jgi:DNA-binding MarR family transcriptional regulator
MTEENPLIRQVDQFILEQIDTVPHLEALLLVWNHRPKAWSISEMASALYVPKDLAARILRDLAQRGLVQEIPPDTGQFAYHSASLNQDTLISQVDATYRRELIRISRMLHAKAPSSLRDFARAFRFTKEKQ